MTLVCFTWNNLTTLSRTYLIGYNGGRLHMRLSYPGEKGNSRNLARYVSHEGTNGTPKKWKTQLKRVKNCNMKISRACKSFVILGVPLA